MRMEWDGDNEDRTKRMECTDGKTIHVRISKQFETADQSTKTRQTLFTTRASRRGYRWLSRLSVPLPREILLRRGVTEGFRNVTALRCCNRLINFTSCWVIYRMIYILYIYSAWDIIEIFIRRLLLKIWKLFHIIYLFRQIFFNRVHSGAPFDRRFCNTVSAKRIKWNIKDLILNILNSRLNKFDKMRLCICFTHVY